MLKGLSVERLTLMGDESATDSRVIQSFPGCVLARLNARRFSRGYRCRRSDVSAGVWRAGRTMAWRDEGRCKDH